MSDAPVTSGFSRTILILLERGLLALGVALAIWCAIVLLEARRTNTMPVPPPPAASAPAPAPRPAPAPGTWIARLEAPSVDLASTVLEGTDDGTLRRGAGHIENTAFPGEPGNVGVAGHRDTIFRPVRKLETGDVLTVTTADRRYQYRISSIRIVNPEDVYVLDPTDRPMLTLVTCYPFEFVGHAPRRYIVHADQIAEEKR